MNVSYNKWDIEGNSYELTVLFLSDCLISEKISFQSAMMWFCKEKNHKNDNTKLTNIPILTLKNSIQNLT